MDASAPWTTNRLAWPPRLGGALRIAHLRIFGHVGGRCIGGLGGGVGQFLGRGFGLLQAHALGVVGLRGFTVLALLVLLTFLVVVVALVFVVLAAAVIAHVERVEKIMDGIAEPQAQHLPHDEL